MNPERDKVMITIEDLFLEISEEEPDEEHALDAALLYVLRGTPWDDVQSVAKYAMELGYDEDEYVEFVASACLYLIRRPQADVAETIHRARLLTQQDVLCLWN